MDILIAVIALIVVPLGIRMLHKAKQPEQSSLAKINTFKNSLPKGFQDFVYAQDDTALALNGAEDKILLQSSGRQQSYNRTEIIMISGKIEDKEIFKLTQGGIPYRVDSSINSQLTHPRIYEKSGIFVRVSDLKTPIWHIKFSDANQMQRCVVALQQFLDGRLAVSR